MPANLKQCMRKLRPDFMVNPKTTILFINLYTEMGGGEVALFHLLKELDRTRFYPVMMFNRNGEFVEKVESIGVATVILPYESVMLSLLIEPRHIWRTMKASREVYAFVRQHPVQIIHCSDVLSLLLISVTAIRFRIPVVYSVIFTYERIRIWLLNLLALFLIDLIVTNSHTIRNDLERKTIFLKKRMTVAYHGVDVSLFTPRRPGEENLLRRELGIDTEVMLVAMVGRFEPSKGHAIFLRAASQIAAQRENIYFVVIGGVLFQDVFPFFGNYHEEIIRLWHDLKLERRLVFIPHRSDIPEVMRSLDLLVMPSVYEGFGLVVLEALASGVPVVASRSVGALEVVHDVSAVYVAEPSDPDSFAHKILEAIDASAGKDPVSVRNGAETVLNGLQWQGYARRMEDIYSSLTEQVTL